MRFASRYDDALGLMRDGEMLALGAPAETLEPRLLSLAFEKDLHVGANVRSPDPLIFPAARVHCDD